MNDEVTELRTHNIELQKAITAEIKHSRYNHGRTEFRIVTKSFTKRILFVKVKLSFHT